MIENSIVFNFFRKDQRLTEGDYCPTCEVGTLELRGVPEDCSCHVSAPCAACERAPMFCSICDEEYKS